MSLPSSLKYETQQKFVTQTILTAKHKSLTIFPPLLFHVFDVSWSYHFLCHSHNIFWSYSLSFSILSFCHVHNISFVMSSFQQVQILYFFLLKRRRKKVQVLSSIVLSFRCVQNLLCRVILQARPHSLLHCVIFWRYSKSLHCCAIFSVFKYSPPPCDLFWFPLCTVEFHYS
jgi:hypothetical protein